MPNVTSSISAHLDAGGPYDPAVAFEVTLDAGFELVERRDVGLARAGLGQVVGELLGFEHRAHLLADLVDNLLRRAGAGEQPLPDGGLVARIELGDAGQVGQLLRPRAARNREATQLARADHRE